MEKSIALPPEIREKIKIRRKLRRTYMKDRNPRTKTEYNRLKNEIKKDIKNEQNRQWKEKLIDLNMNKQVKDWKIVKELMKGKKEKTIYPTLIDSNNLKATSDQEKCNIFQNNLKPIWCSKNDPIRYDDKFLKKVDKEHEMNTHLHSVNFDCPLQEDHIISSDEINSFIMKLDVNKAPGRDTISNKLIKYLSTSLSKILSNIFTNSLRSGHLPSCWKVADVKMIHKKKSKTDPGNYRPVSLLNNLGKIMEKVITTRIYTWAESNNIINKSQSGFRKNNNTTNQIFKLSQTVLQGFNRGQITTVVFLDVEKAFDKVWHKGLLYKLKKKKLPEKYIRWINSFLTEREIKVKINNSLSEEIIPTRGVPQGSPLSPILFILYVADIPTDKTVNTSQFADDIAAWCTHRRNSENEKKLQKYLNKLSVWCNKW